MDELPSFGVDSIGNPEQDVNSGSTSRPATEPVDGKRGYPKLARGATKRGWATERKPGRVEGRDGMTRVRQDMRQPVSSLWQPETERASTAPSRMPLFAGTPGIDATHGSTSRDSSRRRLRSGLGNVTGVEPPTSASRGVPVTRTTGGTCLGVGAEDPFLNDDGVDGDKKRGGGGGGGGGGDKFGTFSAPICGSGDQELTADPGGGRRTPLPLRSSHRVGPIGSLGQKPFFFLIENGSTLSLCYC